MARQQRRKHVIVLGVGFAGLRCVKTLANHPDLLITLVDRHNHHLFQPLLYQVAIAGLEAPQIAEPARALLRDVHNARFLMGRASHVDLEARIVTVDSRRFRYDYLVVATGTHTADYGVPGVVEHAHTLKTLDEALDIRDTILSACEEATATSDPQRRAALLTFIIVGGGATGVELAGAMGELKRHVLPRDYPEIEPDEFRVIMVESSPYPLPDMGEDFGRYTERTLAHEFGVDLVSNARVTEVREDGVVVSGERAINGFTVIWTAGVVGSWIEGLPAPERGRRIATDEFLALPGYPRVFVTGDMNLSTGPYADEPYPQLAQTAVQQGERAAKNIIADIEGKPPRPFRYRDKGVLVTIGRNRGVAQTYGLRFTGFPAWFAWLAIHIVLLVGFRNRILVLVSWIYNYITFDFAVRIMHQRRRFPPRGDVM